jgi:hypothetical protein
MKINEIIVEGGWANPVTQNTKITPQVVAQAFKVLQNFIVKFNEFLKNKNVPPVELGKPAGSTTYYERDLKVNPTKEYGDIDINMFIPRIEGMSNNANADLFKTNLKEFCEGSADYQTENGTNVIFKLGNDYVQVDFITAYYENKAWSTALAPEWNVKGVLCNSLYSSLGEVLNLSIGGGHGVQAKIQDGKIVPFRQNKDVQLVTVTNNPESWALDIAKFLGCKNIAPLLKQYPGKLDEVRVSDMINSIKGITETLELNNKGNAQVLLQKIKQIYLGKIDKVVNSSKFDKAATPAAIEKAQHTKEMLASKSAEFARLFDE